MGKRSALAVEAERLAEQHTVLAQRREAIAAEADDAPPPLPWRGGGRHARAGAPLWRLVRFADGVDPADAAGIEAALEAAGLLDAWVRPDGSVEAEAGGSEAFLAVGAAAPGTRAPTLASVLVPEDQHDVPSAVVVRLLEAVALGDMAPEPQREIDAAGAATTTPRPVVSVARGGSYRLGLLAGRHRVDAPRYIGATARAAHRAARLAALDAELAALDTERSNVDARLADLEGWLAAADIAVARLPTSAGLADALRRRDRSAGQLQGARAHLDDAIAAAEATRRELNDRRASLQREAALRELPATLDGLRGVAAAIDRFADDARDLVTAVERLAERDRALAAATRRHDAAAERARQAGVDLAERTREREARAAELATLRARVGPHAEAIVDELDAEEAAIASGESAAKALGDAAAAAAARRGGAEGEVGAAGEAVEAAGRSAAEEMTRLHGAAPARPRRAPRHRGRRSLGGSCSVSCRCGRSR